MKNIENKYGWKQKKDRTFILAARQRARELGFQPSLQVIEKPEPRISFSESELASMSMGDDFQMAAFIRENKDRGVCKTALKRFAIDMFNKGTFSEDSLTKFFIELGIEGCCEHKTKAAYAA